MPDAPKQRSCNIDDNLNVSQRQMQKRKQIEELVNSPTALLRSGNTLTTFRLAMPANGEFVAKNGGTAISGFNAVVAYVNRIVTFYRNELSVSFTLVSGSNMVYTNAATDPYDNNNQSLMLDQNQANCDAVIGNANYDIGHVWGYVGGSGGGLASSPVVCDNNFKAMGVSGEGDLNTYSQVFMDQLVFHEMGHQFGMSHSYNSSIPVCTTREPTTSVEPGSGATIMSYGFTCSDGVNNDDYFSAPVGGLITGPILQFHTASYAQAIALLSTISCGVTTATGNTPPVVTVPTNYTIPKSTPFALTGSATDVDGDALTFCWEGTNIGTMVPDFTTLANTAQPPFFRSYKPSNSGTRTYPILSSILDGTNYVKGDKLPSVGIVTTHTLTVRDNNAAGGGVSSGTVSVTVNGAIGPFLETTNLTGTHESGTTENITWSVNGTDAATPNVKISLSTDGGYTFPIVLEASTPNDGTQSITWPNVTTSLARIKVEGVGNIFFDISNADFVVQPFAPCATAGTASGPLTLFTNQQGTYTEAGGSAGIYEWRAATVTGGPYTAIPGATTNPASFSFATTGTHYVVLARKVGSCSDAISNELAVVVTVQGDLPCSAIPVVVGNNGPFSNIGATSDVGEVTAPDNQCNTQTGWCTTDINHTIWAKFTAPTSGRVSIAVPGFDNKVALYAVTNCSSYSNYTLLAANDDGGVGNSGLITAVCLTPGTDYYIQINGYQNEEGFCSINITDLGNAIPTFTGCPANINLVATCGTTAAVATWTAPTAADVDNCAALVLNNNFNSGASFPVGTTKVTYTAFDGALTATCSFDVVVTAETRDIIASAGPNGTISSSGTVAVNCGTDKIYDITPDAGYGILSVLVDGVEQGSINSYTFTNVTTTHTIQATFGTIVPITLLSFDAKLLGKNDVLLTWQTATEINNKGYEIEMSTSNLDYRNVAFVLGKGTSSTLSSYENTVFNLAQGTYFIRLKIVDINGQFTYSPVRIIRVVDALNMIAVYPNPTKDGFVYVDLKGNNKNILMIITNEVGQVISKKQYANTNNLLKVKLPAAGAYTIQVITADGNVMVKKLISLQ